MNNASELIEQAKVFTSEINASCRSNVILIPLLSLDPWIQHRFAENNNKAPAKTIVINRAQQLNFIYVNYRFATYKSRHFILPVSISDFPLGRIQSFDYFVRKFKEEEDFRTEAQPVKLELFEKLDLDNLNTTSKLTLDFIQRTVQSGTTAKNTGLEIMMTDQDPDTPENKEHTYYEDANETLNEEINKSFNGTTNEAKEETQFAKATPLNQTRRNPFTNPFINQNSIKQEDDSGKTWKQHKIPRLKESGLGVKDWADKCVFLVEFGREKKLTDTEKCQLILQNVPFASFGPIMDEFQQESDQTFDNLKRIIEDQIQLDEMEAGVTLQNTKFDENRDRDMRRFYERIKKLVKIKYPSLNREGIDTTSMEHFERLIPNYIKNSESWGLDTYDPNDPTKRILLANRIFLMNKDRRHINALTDRKNNLKNKSDSTSKKCNNCGKQGHIRPECRHLPQCYTCGKRGHKSNECRSKGQNRQQMQKRGSFGQPNRQGNYPQQNNNFQNRRPGNFNSTGRNNKQWGQGNQKTGGCFNCGSPHHWKRECTQRQINTFHNNGGRENNHEDDAPFIKMKHWQE